MTENTSPTTNKIVKLPILWPARLKLTLSILLIISAFAAVIIVFKQQLITKQLQAIENAAVNFAGKRGFTLLDVIISGHEKTTIDDINNALKLKRGDNFFDIDITNIKHRLEDLPWVRDASVKRTFLPNILQINIKEKEVLAIWQLNKRFYPIDMDGYVIEADYKPQKAVLLIVGEDAPEHINKLLKIIKEIDADYISRLKIAHYISKRRWNLTFDDATQGITVKLPADNLKNSLIKLINLDKTQSVLKRKLTIIDLRLPDKVIVKMRKDGSHTKK